MRQSVIIEILVSIFISVEFETIVTSAYGSFIYGAKRVNFQNNTLVPESKSTHKEHINNDIYPKYYDREEHPNNVLLPDEECGVSLADRIIGGTEASLGQFPWLGRIGYKIEKCDSSPAYKCGAVIISVKYVITAAHCTANIINGICAATKLSGKQYIHSVRLGEFYTLTDPDCEMDACALPVQDIRVDKVLVHEAYNQPRFKNDISLIRLRDPIQFNEYVTPICLPYGKQTNHNYVGEEGTVAGWGLINTDTLETSSKLMYIAMPILPMNECAGYYSPRQINVTADTQLCVGGNLGKDSCSGDSGGPLMVTDSLNGQPKTFMMGIVSFGPSKCGTTETPAIYTKVVAYSKWILDNMSQN